MYGDMIMTHVHKYWWLLFVNSDTWLCVNASKVGNLSQCDKCVAVTLCSGLKAIEIDAIINVKENKSKGIRESVHIWPDLKLFELLFKLLFSSFIDRVFKVK